MAFFVLCALVFLSGCDKRAVEQAQQEAREAKATVQQLKHNLALAEKEFANAKAELNVVKQNRDELQEQVKQATEERDQALELAQKAQEAVLAKSGGQTSATAALQQQITELNALVAEQEKLIEQLKKGEAAEPVPLPDEPLPTEPNEG
jgi:flagellar biosynthesis chaperone FliJ